MITRTWHEKTNPIVIITKTALVTERQPDNVPFSLGLQGLIAIDRRPVARRRIMMDGL